ncbi:helix-turn-helix domain-containing protein [Gordonia sp. X0973]|uniref:helix-turn-helix domain-containing protein n=1 Tax=Gordonia sp. X0973 TaxID=2742602 RepID=UPI000F539255|nr:helix-turn-helix domain-containing protein [Gordonia sp. X0973]QKT06595.1 helix-turn-helix domain-containing protein [Gordonia sp. X0973]
MGGSRDRLRELLDAVLDEENRTLGDMADDAYASPFHFTRQLTRDAGEAPVAMRRRVMLERAAWQLHRGSTVTDAAWAAGYESVDGFSRAFARAFGHPPSNPAASHWLPAPNGIHFHPPMSLWVHAKETTMNPLTEHLVAHDLDETRELLDRAKQVPDEQYRRVVLTDHAVNDWEGPEGSLAQVLRGIVRAKEAWIAAIEGTEFPSNGDDDPVALIARHDEVAPRWLAMVRDVERRGAWNDRFIDALCEPPESFVLSGVIAHVITFDAARRHLARHLLRVAGVDPGDGDPINWARRVRGEEPGQ